MEPERERRSGRINLQRGLQRLQLKFGLRLLKVTCNDRNPRDEFISPNSHLIVIKTREIMVRISELRYI